MNNQLYKKEGRRYIPIGYHDGFSGFPKAGLWAVYDGVGSHSESCLAFAGEFKNIDYSLLASLVKEKTNDCLDAISELSKKPHSSYEIVMTVFETVLKNEK